MASRAFVTTFRETNLVAGIGSNWDSTGARQARYATAEGHYTSTIYLGAQRYASKLKEDYGLYKHIRSIYNPVHTLVEFYVAAVYGGNLDFQTLEKGAVPIMMASDQLKEAIRATWLASNWRSRKNLYARTGAKKGDVFLWVADDMQRGKVVMEVLEPEKVTDFTPDSVGNAKACVLEYQRTDDDGKDYQYKLEVDKEWFAEYRENKLVADWRNPYGFVPLVHTKHIDVGMLYGAYCFHGAESLIDEMDDAASVLNDAVRKSVNIVYYGAGVTSTAELDASADNRDEIPIIFGPKESSLQPLTPQLNIADAGANLDRLRLGLEHKLPELGFNRMKELANPTAPGVRAAAKDVLDRAAEAQGNYDDGYIRAQKMAVSIGGYRGYDGYRGFNLDSYAAGKLEFYVKERDLIDDSLSKSERMQALRDGANLQGKYLEAYLNELEVDAPRIAEIIADLEEKQEQRARAEARGFADSVFGADDEAQPQANPQAGPAATGSGVGEAGGVQPQPAG